MTSLEFLCTGEQREIQKIISSFSDRSRPGKGGGLGGPIHQERVVLKIETFQKHHDAGQDAHDDDDDDNFTFRFCCS
jgi:hypothetical protein